MKRRTILPLILLASLLLAANGAALGEAQVSFPE